MYNRKAKAVNMAHVNINIEDFWIKEQQKSFLFWIKVKQRISRCNYGRIFYDPGLLFKGIIFSKPLQ